MLSVATSSGSLGLVHSTKKLITFLVEERRFPKCVNQCGYSNHLMYLLKVYAKTQFRSKSLKQRESTINENSKEWYIISWL